MADCELQTLDLCTIRYAYSGHCLRANPSKGGDAKPPVYGLSGSPHEWRVRGHDSGVARMYNTNIRLTSTAVPLDGHTRPLPRILARRSSPGRDYVNFYFVKYRVPVSGSSGAKVRR